MDYQSVTSLITNDVASLNTRFAAACEFGAVLKSKAGQKLEIQHKGKLYGLYKQGRYGSFDQSLKEQEIPSMLTPMFRMYTRLKEQEWIKFKDYSKDDAKEAYINTIVECTAHPKYQDILQGEDFSSLVDGSFNFYKLKTEIEQNAAAHSAQNIDEAEHSVEKQEDIAKQANPTPAPSPS